MKRLHRSLKWMGRHLNWFFIAFILGVGVLYSVDGEPVPLSIFWLWLGVLIFSRLEIMVVEATNRILRGSNKLLGDTIKVLKEHIDLLRERLDL